MVNVHQFIESVVMSVACRFSLPVILLCFRTLIGSSIVLFCGYRWLWNFGGKHYQAYPLPFIAILTLKVMKKGFKK
jgi:hypothetical protein